MSQTLNAKHRAVKLLPGFYVIRGNNFDANSAIAVLNSMPLSAECSVQSVGAKRDGALLLSYQSPMAVVRVEGGEATVAISILRASSSKEQSITLDVERLPDSLLKNQAPSSSLVYLTGHVEWKGEVRVLPGTFLGSKNGSARIEGFAINWLNKKDNIDIKYGCTFGEQQETSTALGGGFVGSRRQSAPITSLWMELEGSAANQYQLQYNAVFAKAGSVCGGQAEVVSGSDDTDYLVGLWVSVVDAGSDSPDISLQSGRKVKELKTFRA